MDELLNWWNQYSFFFSALAGLSLLLFVLSIAATPWFIASLPSDYLQPKTDNPKRSGAFGALLRTLKNVFGFLLVVLGLILMITPGPGLIVLLVGISVAEFPGKQQLLVKIAVQPNVFRSLNWMRFKHGKQPFENPATTL